MKKFKVLSLLMLIAVMIFGGMMNANALISLPDSVVSDAHKNPTLVGGLREVEYIKNFPVIVKTADNGKYYIYCMNLSATYAANIKFSKAGTVDPGYIYILNHKPNTGDKDKDFYITQMAVWYYEDYLSGKDFNLVREVKEYIVSNVEKDPVARYIYNLYRGAKVYKGEKAVLQFDKSNISFTIENGYYVSSKIEVIKANTTGNLKYSLTNAPAGSKVVKAGEDGVKVKIPAEKIPEGKQLTFSLNIEGAYTEYTGYYYYHSNKYQKVLFQDPLETKVALKDSVSLNIKHYKDEYDVNISKTDVTQSKEVPGATLVVKDNKGAEVASWVSTTEPKRITLKTGEYTLTETLAPQGYKLSKTTIHFYLDEKGGLFVKNEQGNYVSVNKVVMINELIDMISVAKKDSKTGELLSNAKLVIKDATGNVVNEFTTSGSAYQLSLPAGKYTLSEVEAPAGYVLSKEVLSFELLEDGTLRVMNKEGVYTDSAYITFYNTKESQETVHVPATGKNATLMIIGGIALLIGGIACAKKTIKEC